MKTLFVGLLVVSLMTTLTVASVAEVKPFVFGLSFNEGFVSGDTVTDQGGRGNNATLNNGAKVVPNGKYGNAIEFDGVDDYVEVEMDVPEENFTMALWIKTDSPDVGVYSVLDGRAGAGGHDRHWVRLRNILHGTGVSLASGCRHPGPGRPPLEYSTRFHMGYPQRNG